MIISVIFLLPLSLTKNKLDWVKFFVSQLSLNFKTSRDLPVIQNLQNLIRLPENKLLSERRYLFYKLRQTLGI